MASRSAVPEIRWRRHDLFSSVGLRPPFVNTSVHFLNGFDYLYDADGGFVGFRWTGDATPTIGKVVPSTARPAN